MIELSLETFSNESINVIRVSARKMSIKSIVIALKMALVIGITIDTIGIHNI